MRMTPVVWLVVGSTLAAAAPPTTPRARDLGVPFEGTPGTLNAITDVPGVEVGHTTLILDPPAAKKPIRTGVTAIFPRGSRSDDPVFGAWFPLNGNGELTGTAWLKEGGFLEGPVLFTNTHSVGTVRDAVIAWRIKRGAPDASGYYWSLTVVGETWDGWLNDINAFAVKPEHTFAALDAARGGAVAEGNVGGGTGMVCFEFKGGIGTASRVVKAAGATYTVGAIVQCNCGLRPWLTIAGVPVGKEIQDGASRQDEYGSILIVVATDAPLLPHQLERVAHRAALGLARVGSYSGNGSGDLMLAFSTANPHAAFANGLVSLAMLPNDALDRVFEATAQSVEEAIVNAMVAGRTMDGVDGHRIIGLPHERLQEVMKKYHRGPGAALSPPDPLATATPP
ncbi:MAG: P1 family peptidase [Acidobacteriota bacterium]